MLCEKRGWMCLWSDCSLRENLLPQKRDYYGEVCNSCLGCFYFIYLQKCPTHLFILDEWEIFHICKIKVCFT